MQIKAGSTEAQKVNQRTRGSWPFFFHCAAYTNCTGLTSAHTRNIATPHDRIAAHFHDGCSGGALGAYTYSAECIEECLTR